MRTLLQPLRHSLKLSVLLAGALTFTSLASAQVERLNPRSDGSLSGPAGKARFLKSGALLLASFDTNQDFIVTEEEVEAGARNTFKIADADGNDLITPIEQRNWAALMAGDGDVLENSSFFRSAIPNQVTLDEFIEGIKIFSTTFKNSDGEILFTAFTVNPKGEAKKKDNLDDEIERLTRPKVSENSVPGN